MKIGKSYFGDLFSTCQQVLGYPCHIWYSLGPKSLTHNHSTRAGPVKIRCVMTGVFDRKWEGCDSVPKHWGCFKLTLKIFANFDPWLKRMTCWCVISLRRCRKMAVHSLRSIQLMTGEPWPRYSALQLLGVSGACGAKCQKGNGNQYHWLYWMMTSSNGNIFRVTGHLCGEFTGHRWIPRTKANVAELWCFLWSAPE